MAKVIRFNLKDFLNYSLTYIKEEVKIIFHYSTHEEVVKRRIESVQGYEEIRFRRSAWIIFYEPDDILKDKKECLNGCIKTPNKGQKT